MNPGSPSKPGVTREEPCNCSGHLTYTKGFPLLAEGLDVVILKTSATGSNMPLWGGRSRLGGYIKFESSAARSRKQKAFATEKGTSTWLNPGRVCRPCPELQAFKAGLGALYGFLVLYMLPVSVHHRSRMHLRVL